MSLIFKICVENWVKRNFQGGSEQDPEQHDDGPLTRDSNKESDKTDNGELNSDVVKNSQDKTSDA